MATVAQELSTATTAYLDNAGYFAERSKAKAALFVDACRKLLLLMPSSTASGRGASEMQLDKESVRAELAKAERWLRANDSDRYRPVVVGDARRLR